MKILEKGVGDYEHRISNSISSIAAFHKRKDIVEAIENKGHITEWLPPYSPDLNPIEQKWSQAKSLKRKIICSTQDLFQKYDL